MKESTSFCWVTKGKINCFYACLALGILVNANRVGTFCFVRQKAQILSKFAGAIMHCWGVPQMTRVRIPPQQGEKKRLPFSVREVWPWSWSRSETSFNTSIYLSPPSRFGSNWKWMQLRLNGVFLFVSWLHHVHQIFFFIFVSKITLGLFTYIPVRYVAGGLERWAVRQEDQADGPLILPTPGQCVKRHLATQFLDPHLLLCGFVPKHCFLYSFISFNNVFSYLTTKSIQPPLF